MTQVRSLRRRALVTFSLVISAGALSLHGPLPGATSAADAATARPSWVGNYETGSFSQFQTTPWNHLPKRPTIVKSPRRGGRYIGRYEIPAGGARSENVPRTSAFRPGQSRWFAFSTRLRAGFPLSTSQFQVLAQWKNDGEGSPPLQLNVSRGRYEISGGWGWPGTANPSTPKLSVRSLGVARTKTWENWVVHVRFSPKRSVGYVDVWRNGHRRVSRWHPTGGTLYPGKASYLKVGYYRSQAIRSTGVVYHDSWRVGTTRAAVR